MIIRDKKGRFVKGKVSHRKGLTLEQEYGKERAEEIRKKQSKHNERRWQNPIFRENMIRKLKEREMYWADKIDNSGKKNPFYGKHHIEKTKEILREQRKGKSLKEVYGEGVAKKIEKSRRDGLKKFQSNKENLKKIGIKISKTKRELIRKGLLNPMKGNTNPSQAELILKNIIEKNNLPFNHTGNGVIYFHGENHSFNPDFLSKNPKHIIEVFGDYWHNRKDAKLKDIERLATYARYGYKTLVIWEHELVPRWKNNLTEEQIVNKIRRFIK